MAYNQDEIIEQALKVIEEEECVTIDEVCLYLPIGRNTLYSWELDKLNKLKEAIEGQKIKQKKKMRRNWRNSDNATLQIAEFKLMANVDELETLTISKVKQDVKVELPKVNFSTIDGTKEHTSL